MIVDTLMDILDDMPPELDVTVNGQNITGCNLQYDEDGLIVRCDLQTKKKTA